MSRNTFVYSHPINVYIIVHLGMTVERFCALYDYSQGTVASWISRERRIEALPASFIYDLSLAASLDMTEVYHELLLLQDDYDYFTSQYGQKTKKDIE